MHSFNGTFQAFTPGLLSSMIVKGGPIDSTLFIYNVYLYLQAFSYFEMGYASAMAWVLISSSAWWRHSRTSRR